MSNPCTGNCTTCSTDADCKPIPLGSKTPESIFGPCYPNPTCSNSTCISGSIDSAAIGCSDSTLGTNYRWISLIIFFLLLIGLGYIIYYIKFVKTPKTKPVSNTV